jgi:hypothetical protein
MKQNSYGVCSSHVSSIESLYCKDCCTHTCETCALLTNSMHSVISRGVFDVLKESRAAIDSQRTLFGDTVEAVKKNQMTLNIYVCV